MLIDDAHRYIELRRSLGFKLKTPARFLLAFAEYAERMGETHVRNDTVMTWAAASPSTHDSYYRRVRIIALFARFARAEDPAHEVPPHQMFSRRQPRPAPYIYSPEDIERMLMAARGLRAPRRNPLRPHTCEMLFGLLAATGLRISEALSLRLNDVLPGGVLHIRKTKFGKSRLVPLHPSVVAALDAYLRARQRYAGLEDHLFLTECGRPMSYASAKQCFYAILRRAKIGEGRARKPRVHDLRHTFATRVLEQCGAGSGEIARDFIALSTYLGHTHIQHTYWYLEATAELMGDIAAAAETFVIGRRV